MEINPIFADIIKRWRPDASPTTKAHTVSETHARADAAQEIKDVSAATARAEVHRQLRLREQHPGRPVKFLKKALEDLEKCLSSN